jgi:hypothetical protein
MGVTLLNQTKIKEISAFKRNFGSVHFYQIVDSFGQYRYIKDKIVKDYEMALEEKGYHLDKYPFSSLDDFKKMRLVSSFKKALYDVSTLYNEYGRFSAIMAGLAGKPNNMMRMTVVIVSILDRLDWSEDSAKHYFYEFFSKLDDYHGDVVSTCYHYADLTLPPRKTQMYDLLSIFPAQTPGNTPHADFGDNVSNTIVREGSDYATKGILPARNIEPDLAKKTNLEINKYDREFREREREAKNKK